MAGIKKDVELIFRGEDRASPTIKSVRDNVKDLTKAIGDQTAAAERGENTIDDLAKVYRRLKDAQGDVTEITKLAAAYDKLTNQHAAQAIKAEEARAKEAALTAEIAAAKEPTKRLTNSRDAAARSADAAAQKEKDLARDVKLAGEAFEQAGGDIKNFEASQDAIRVTALETARALRVAGDAMDNYGTAAAKGAAARKSLEEASRFNTLADKSGLPQEQITFISALENRVEALSQAMRENKAAADAMNRAIADRAKNQADTEYALLAQRLREAAQEANRLQAATQFKNQAAGIEAGARDISRFGAAADTAATSGRRLADTIQGMIAPAQGASRSIDGINSIIDKSEALFDGTKRRMSEYNSSLNDIQAAQAGLTNIAKTIDDFRAQEIAVAGASAAMRDAQSDVLRFAGAIQTAENPTEQMVAELVRAEAALERTGNALTKETIKLRQLENALEGANIDVRQLDTMQEQLINSTQRLGAAQTRLRGVSQGAGGLFGLNPNELQNLGYQVNDIVVSIASGQNPLTVFIQQGAQIGQIWPGAFSKIAARAPVLLGILAVVVPLGAAMGEAAEDARRMSEGITTINSMGDIGTGIDASKLASAAEKLEEIGLKAKEANQALRELVADGLNAGQIDQYIDTAKAAATVTGVDFKEALDQVREGFQGGFEDIVSLDEATNAFTDSEMALIEQLFEQGRADEARATALEIYNNKMNDSAAQANGPWKVAIDNLGQAWNRFVQWLSDTAPIQAAANAVAFLGRQAAYWAARLAGKSAQEADAASNGKSVKPRQVRLGDANRQTAGGQKQIREQEEALAGARAVTAEQRKQIATRKAMNAAIDAGATSREADKAAAIAGAAFDATEAQKASKRADSAGKKRDSARKREARAAESAARQIAAAEEQLQRQLEQLDAAVAKNQDDSLERRLTAIDSQYAKLFRSIDEYSTKTSGRGKIGDLSIEQAREQVRLQQQQLKNYETLEFREKQLGNLLKERSERLDAIDDKVARGIISPTEGLDQADVVINDIATRVSTMATDAIAFAEALRGAVPSPQLDTFIATMRTALQNNSGGQNQRESQGRRTGAIEKSESALNLIISQRAELVERENMLVALGLQTRSQAQTNIEAQYNRTAILIRKQIADIRALAASFGGNLTPEMQLYFDSLEARLQGADLQANFVNARFTEMKGSIDQLLTTNIIGFIDALAQSFADLVTGNTDVLGFFASIGRAFLDMIAKTLSGIAQLILQMIILDTVEKFTGIPVRALLKLYGGAGVFHEGGIAGQVGGRSRQVSPMVFAGAPRYHTGGIAGLAPDEVGTILRKNEEVLTEADPRHRFNGGLNPAGGGGAPMSQKAVLAVGDEQIAAAMMGGPGEEVTMFHLRRNKASIKQMLDN